MTRSPIGFVSLALALVAASGARADKIAHPTAVFAGLDKITGRIISFDVATDETVQFGSLQITPRVCYTRPATEAPQTDGFVEVDEVEADNSFKRIFSGWMFAASPGLHGVEHPVYDVWLTDCKGDGSVIPDVTAALPQEDLSPPPGGAAGAKGPTAPALRGRNGRPPAVNQADLPPPGGENPAGFPSEPGQPARPTFAGGQRPPRPPAAIGPAPTRRQPSQSFFPTTANPGDSQHERDLEH